MSDRLTPEQRSNAMKRVKLRDGSLEKVVQRALRLKGLNFQRHVRKLPGSPDVVFAKKKIAVFIDGDFWHGWRLPSWEHKLSQFWRDKLRVNRARDRRNFRKLRAKGWTVVCIWQHQIKNDIEKCIRRIEDVVLN